jgi:hypothetical protein
MVGSHWLLLSFFWGEISLESNYFRLTRLFFGLCLDALNAAGNKIEGDVN